MSNLPLPKPVYSPTDPARKKWIGAPMKRKEDLPLITGTGRFVDDVNLKGMLHAAFYRSPYAHARIRNVDIREALQTPGVVAVFTGDDLVQEVKPLLSIAKILKADMFAAGPVSANRKPSVLYGLAVGKVKYVGEPVAVVVATDRYTAVDGAEKIMADYEPLPAVVDPEKAMQQDSAVVHEEYGDNIAAEYEVEGGDIDKAFAEADRLLHFKLDEHRHAAASMECRGVVADYSPFARKLTVWGSLQNALRVKNTLAAWLDLPEPNIRVVNEFVGGSYGEKQRTYEEFLIAYLAKKLARPIKWIATRTEHLLTTGHARDEIFYMDVAVTNEGRILGLKVRQIMDTGYMLFGPNLLTAGVYIPGPYKIENYQCNSYAVTTNKASFAAYRALIKLDSNYAIERTMDLIARELHLPAHEVRFKNFIQPEEFPYRMVTGCVYDSGDYPEALRRALSLVGYDEIKAKQEAWRQQGKYVGVAASMAVEPTGAGRPTQPAADFTTLRVEPGGSVLVLQGLSSNSGQGHQTSLSQIIADELGVTPEMITVPEGDTAVSKSGSAYSSRFSVVSVSSATLAARSLRKKILDIASHLMEIPAEELDMREGNIFLTSNPSRGMTLREMANFVNNFPFRLPAGSTPSLEVTEWFESPNIIYQKDAQGRTGFFSAFPYAAFAAVVEVDIETGALKVDRFIAVHDCGTIINPAIMEVQDQGGFIQGLGGSMYEHIVYDENGQLLNPTFADYLTPGINEALDLETHSIVSPSPYTILGTKGGGETCLIGPFVTLPAAVEDALAEFGVTITWSLLSPENILNLIR
jgi:carbon-monoxide dehydrogenase large subunit